MEVMIVELEVGFFQQGRNDVNKSTKLDFPGGPVVKTLRFHCRGAGSIPGRGTKILHAVWHGQKKKKK